MPAPSPGTIQNFLTTALLAKGFTKKTYVDGLLVEDATKLPEKLAELVGGLSTGLSQEWVAWQAAQGVVAQDTVTLAPVIGAPGTALP